MSAQTEKLEKFYQVLSQESKELYLTEHITEVEERLSPLKFYRDHVAKNLPLLIKNGAKHWKAVGKWNIPYFRQVMQDKEVSVAVTPNGYADAIATGEDGREYFVQPEERKMKISEFLDNIEKPDDSEVLYIQQQNSNFESEYSELWHDVGRDISWATEAFGKDPDAINFWMGDKRAVTSMHKDPYENIYCVISGEKEFILHPPTDLAWIPYGKYPPAIYKKISDKWIVQPTSVSNLDNDLKQPSYTPWISIDPLNPDYNRYPRYKNVHTLRVKVMAGDVLYLPSLWFHHVRQSHGCVAINFWYDMEYDIKYSYYQALESLME